MKTHSFLLVLLLNCLSPLHSQETEEAITAKNITVEISGEDKPVACHYEEAVKTYLCPNDNHPILIRSGFGGPTALGRDENNLLQVKTVNSVEGNGKTLYKALFIKGTPGMGMASDMPGTPYVNQQQQQSNQDQSGFSIFSSDGSTPISSNPGSYGGGYGGEVYKRPKTLGSEYMSRVNAIEDFFAATSYSPYANTNDAKGSDEYEKLKQISLKEKDDIKKLLDNHIASKLYQVELQGGEKINCQRGKARELSGDEKSYNEKNGSIQCAVFKCDKVKIDGKEYNATLLFNSAPNLLGTITSVVLTDENGFGPLPTLRKISSPGLDTPLVDDSASLDKGTNGYPSFKKDSDFFPQSLKSDKRGIELYKDFSFEQNLNWSASICTDEESLITNIKAARTKLNKKLSELELVQFIELLGDGTLISQLVESTQAKAAGCSYEGVYFNEQAAKKLNLLKANIHPDKRVFETITSKKANELFKKATEMKDIAWKYKQDGCFARAHLMARRFEAEGVRVDKVWLKGDLSVANGEEKIEWNYHVAPIVYVEDGLGKIAKMVIDPSLFDKPVTVEEWDKKITKNTVRGTSETAFPFPENSAFMERASLAFSSSDPFFANESIKTTEEEKMKMAADTMKQFKEME